MLPVFPNPESGKAGINSWQLFSRCPVLSSHGYSLPTQDAVVVRDPGRICHRQRSPVLPVTEAIGDDVHWTIAGVEPFGADGPEKARRGAFACSSLKEDVEETKRGWSPSGPASLPAFNTT
jgi:hypothetical protein